MKKILTRPQAPLLAHFGHKNQRFSKYLKNASLDFFYFLHEFRTNWGLQSEPYVIFPKILVCGWQGVKSQIWYRFGNFRPYIQYCSPNLVILCMNVLSQKPLRFLLPVDKSKPLFSILSSFQAPCLANFGHKSQHFSKYLKNSSLDFFNFWHEIRDN